MQKKVFIFTSLFFMIVLSSALISCFVYGLIGGYEQIAYCIKGATYKHVIMPNTFFWNLNFNQNYLSDQSEYNDAKNELIDSLNALPDIEYAGIIAPEVDNFNVKLKGTEERDISKYVVSEFYAKMYGVLGVDGDSSVFYRKYQIDDIIPIVVSGGYNNTQDYELNQILDAEFLYSNSKHLEKKYPVKLKIIGFMKPPYSLDLPLNSSNSVCFIIPEIQYDMIKFPYTDIHPQTKVGIKYKDGDGIVLSENIIKKYGYTSVADDWKESDDSVWQQAAFAVPAALLGLIVTSVSIIVSLLFIIKDFNIWKRILITIVFGFLTFVFAKYILRADFSKWALTTIFGKELDLSMPFIPIYISQDKISILLIQIIIAICSLVILIILCSFFIKSVLKRG